MARKTFRTVPFRRALEGKTNYKRRITQIKSGLPKLVVRRSISNFLVQVVEYVPEGDKTLANVLSKELTKYGWNAHRGNIPSAYLTGYLAGVKAKAAKVKEVIVDMGYHKSAAATRIYAAVKGFQDAGVAVKVDEEMLPSDERVSGKHIEAYAESLKADKAAYEKRFSAYIKNKVDPTKISELFESTKEKISKA